LSRSNRHIWWFLAKKIPPSAPRVGEDIADYEWSILFWWVVHGRPPGFTISPRCRLTAAAV
jgi:hypothetical protein